MRGMGLPGPGAALALAASLLLLMACKKEENTYVPPPPPPVGVSQPLNITVTPYIDYTGNTVAVNQVNLEARVEGFLTDIDYVDGASVEKGKTLFVIEQPPYQAQLAEAQAKLKSLQAQRAYAQAQLQRQTDLAPKGFSTQADLDQARAKRDSLDADILDAKAGIDIATINLGYTEVKAPFDGVVTNHLQSVGALVGVTSPTQLATIVQIDPIWMTFNMSEQDVLRIRANMAKRKLTLKDIDKVPCEVGLMIEEGFPHIGRLDYAAPEVDPSTGTLHGALHLREQEPKPDPRLLRSRAGAAPRPDRRGAAGARCGDRDQPARPLSAGGGQGQFGRAAGGRGGPALRQSARDHQGSRRPTTAW